MSAPKNDKFKDYTRYAQHCLDMVPIAVHSLQQLKSRFSYRRITLI